MLRNDWNWSKEKSNLKNKVFLVKVNKVNKVNNQNRSVFFSLFSFFKQTKTENREVLK